MNEHAKSSMTTIAILEDDDQFREKLARVLERQADFQVVACASRGEKAAIEFSKYQPNVILVDIQLPGKSGIDCICELKELCPESEIIILTFYEDSELIFKAFQEGANGYILKTSRPEELYEGVRNICSGGAPISIKISRKITQYFREKKANMDDVEKLSTQEREVLRFLSTGYTYKDVAEEMGLSIETVRTYVKRSCSKFQVKNKIEAVIKYKDSESL